MKKLNRAGRRALKFVRQHEETVRRLDEAVATIVKQQERLDLKRLALLDQRQALVERHASLTGGSV